MKEEMEYVIKKIKKRSASYSVGPDEPCQINFIYKVSKLRIFYYNFRLYLMFLRRKRNGKNKQ